MTIVLVWVFPVLVVGAIFWRAMKGSRSRR
jgi:hypothetical protein